MTAWTNLTRIGSQLVFPLIALAFLTSYWVQVWPLSFEAKIFPMIVSIGAFIFLIGSLFDTIREVRLGVGEDEAARDSTWLRLLFVLGNTGLIALWPIIGTPTGLFLSMALSMFVFGAKRIVPVLVTSVVTSALLSYTFGHVLSARLPQGSLINMIFG